jgi:hypothetical protein
MKKQILLFIVFFGLGFIGFKVFFPKGTEEKITEEKPKPALKIGNWTLESDPYSTLDISENQLTFKYGGNFSNDTDVYHYSLIENTEGEESIIIKMHNKIADTLRYEIIGRNDTLLNLMDLQYGRINTFVLKK